VIDGPDVSAPAAPISVPSKPYDEHSTTSSTSGDGLLDDDEEEEPLPNRRGAPESRAVFARRRIAARA
jgi:hypothetical protein